MSDLYDNQKKSGGDFRKLLQERIEETNPRCELTNEETKRLAKLEAGAVIESAVMTPISDDYFTNYPN